MENIVKDIIHDLATNEAGIYTSLYFAESEVLSNFTFNIAFNITDDEDVIKEDIKFLIDNMIAKSLELNFKIKYTKSTYDELGAKISYDGVKTKNGYIINNYHFNSLQKLYDLENYINDLQVIITNNRYIINWTVPIYKLDLQDIISI